MSHGKGQPGHCVPCPSPSSEHGDSPLPRHRDPHQTNVMRKNNHHQKLCKIPLPPVPSSVKVKFHAKAILFLFNYQLAPGTWSSPDRFSLVWLHKARETGLRRGGGMVLVCCAGLGETWEPATGAAQCHTVPWELAGWASQGGQAMGQSPSWLLDTQGCSSTCGLS